MRDKYKLLFAMCDIHGNGRVRRAKFAEFVRSLNAVVGVSITESSQNHVIENILCRSGEHLKVLEEPLLCFQQILASFVWRVQDRRSRFRFGIDDELIVDLSGKNRTLRCQGQSPIVVFFEPDAHLYCFAVIY